MINGQTWLIDTSPDLRFQCLREGLSIDGVIYTHAHFDHVGGLEELKPFVVSKGGVPLPIWADNATLLALKSRCPYAFVDINQESPDLYRPFLQENIIDCAFEIQGTWITPFTQNHRYSHTLGFRFSSWAYSTDVWELDDEAFSLLKGIDLWIVGCLTKDLVHSTHAHLEKVLQWVDIIKPNRVILTHMGHSMNYDELVQELPSHIVPAYDGMVIEAFE
jgi:phosphoribosyl 1,2-cyclic phosphate phosphodiesterase